MSQIVEKENWRHKPSTNSNKYALSDYSRSQTHTLQKTKKTTTNRE